MEKKVGVNQPKRLENARILIANTSMDTDKIKVFGSKVKVDSTAKVAELELAEKVSLGSCSARGAYSHLSVPIAGYS